MTSTAISAQGSTLQVDSSTPGTADTAIGNLKTFSGLDGEAGELDVTNLSSTAKEYVAALQDFGGFSLEWDNDYSDTGQTLLRTAQAAGASKTFLLTLPDASTVTFVAIVKNAQSISGGVDAAITGGATLKVSGSPTFA